jgi:hypothetical protein
MVDSGSTGLAQEFWHNIRKGFGRLQASQDKDLESIAMTNKNVIVAGRHIKQPENNKAQQELRRQMANDLMIAAYDVFIFGDKDGKGKGDPKVLNDGYTNAMIVEWGIRSPWILSSEENESKTVE